MSDKLRGDEARCIAALCNREGAEKASTCGTERHWVSATDCSIGTPAVGALAQ